MNAKDAARAAYRLRHLDNARLVTLMAGWGGGWDDAMDRAEKVQTEFERKRAHAVIQVFEDADEDTTADEIMQDVFEAIGLVESFTGPSALRRSKEGEA